MLDYGNQFDGDGVQYIWNSHSIMAWEKCPRFYQYSILNGYVPVPVEAGPTLTGNVHLDFGGLIASSMQRYFINRFSGMDRLEAVEDCVDHILQATWLYDLTPEGEPIPGTGHGIDWGDTNKDRGTLLRTFVWYFEHYKDDLAIAEYEGKPAVELLIQVPVDDGLIFAGHIDRVVKYESRNWPMDQKTTGATFPKSYDKKWKPHTQMSMYTFLTDICFPESVPGVIIDGMQIAVGFTRFERFFTYRTKSELEEWYQSSMKNIAEAREATRQNEFHMRATSCDLYGGCTFRKICSRSPEVRKNYLAGEFIQKGGRDGEK